MTDGKIGYKYTKRTNSVAPCSYASVATVEMAVTAIPVRIEHTDEPH